VGRLLALGGLCALVAGLVVAVAAARDSSRRAHTFDSRVWKQPRANCSDSPRSRMADDLVKHHLRTGMRMTAVRRLLGRPDSADRTGWIYEIAGSDLYSSGLCVRLSLDMSGGRLTHVETFSDSD
jgi:hypothetical protein